MELAEDEQSDSTSEKEDEDPNLQCYMNDWQEKGTNQKQLTVHYVNKHLHLHLGKYFILPHSYTCIPTIHV